MSPKFVPVKKQSTRSLKTGISFIFGFFGSGKTVYQTLLLKLRHKRPGEITASTYWTAYTHLHCRSREDIARLWWDVFMYHYYVRFYHSMTNDELAIQPPEYFEGQQLFFQFLSSIDCPLENLPSFNRITFAMDEGSIYFNNEHFQEVFKGENAKLLELLYQPRKIRMHFLIGIQSPSEIHIKFRRLGTEFHYFEKIFGFWRRYIEFYVLDPENFTLDPANVKEISRSTSFNWYSFRWIFKLLRIKNPFKLLYNTDEVIHRNISVYTRGDLFRFLYGKKQLRFDNNFDNQ